MSKNILHLNESKTEIIVFGPASTSVTLKATFSQFKFDLKKKKKLKNLAYIIDNLIVRFSFFHLCQISKIESFLNFMDTKKD